jgi:hypothetical protein
MLSLCSKRQVVTSKDAGSFDAPLGLQVQGNDARTQKHYLAYSTVTLLARFLGLSTSHPSSTAMW